MELLVFRPKEFQRWYNCSYYEIEEWNSHRIVRVGMGVVCLTIGMIYCAVYLPCMYIMTTKHFWKHSCYKLMFLLGIMDILGLLVNTLSTGYLMINGDYYCTKPAFIYIAGCIGLGAWGGQCMSCVILGFNRCVEFWNTQSLLSIFRGKAALLWYMPIIAYFIAYACFSPPCLFSSMNMMWMQNPYYGFRSIKVDEGEYRNYFNAMNNIVMLVLLVFFNVFLIVSIRYRGQKGSSHVNELQKQVTIQAVLLCTAIMMPAGLYVYMDYFDIPDWLKLVNLFAWQFSNGCAIFIYTFLNKSIRIALFELIAPWTKKTSSVIELTHITFSRQAPIFRRTKKAPISCSKSSK
ncbi:hypothetical protein QR680_016406 [Steinernema hermaphroditum]|uniref:Uncharacterized protein n=1 Tax=Steinernema hermaphroditum TaxID=289476 RepID=A0AA39HDL4_9BILA|nr:hypothetical protein QR680_016406 [Steinernema hermaphroditum]